MRDPGSPGPEPGFTLVELLVVMVIIGILAAIAVPVLLGQRRKAVDTATRGDVTQIGRAVAAHFVSSAAPPSVVIANGSYQVGDELVSRVGAGVVVAGSNPSTVDTADWSPSAWCLQLTNPAGDVRTLRYSARAGLQPGGCASTTSD